MPEICLHQTKPSTAIAPFTLHLLGLNQYGLCSQKLSPAMHPQDKGVHSAFLRRRELWEPPNPGVKGGRSHNGKPETL